MPRTTRKSARPTFTDRLLSPSEAVYLDNTIKRARASASSTVVAGHNRLNVHITSDRARRYARRRDFDYALYRLLSDIDRRGPMPGDLACFASAVTLIADSAPARRHTR